MNALLTQLVNQQSETEKQFETPMKQIGTFGGAPAKIQTEEPSPDPIAS